MLFTGSCMCGKIKYQADAEPIAKAFSGSAFTTNFIIPRSTFKVLSGNPKSGEYMADSGYIWITGWGSREGGGGKIDAEAYAERRVAYLEPIVGANQVEGMIQP
ncbi:Mss4-like protein [Penicillium frequentans]|uniref:Mss4-like protein n=1 Tax=Penicillium frequentans TaxID=3151616 RepID=A0AAD6CZ18_9EURO|nr:Mss4-like protein [Penicillium glabrum]KAJ5544000.1 Mss4-like protein [Penicillium glabrum]